MHSRSLARIVDVYADGIGVDPETVARDIASVQRWDIPQHVRPTSTLATTTSLANTAVQTFETVVDAAAPLATTTSRQPATGLTLDDFHAYRATREAFGVLLREAQEILITGAVDEDKLRDALAAYGQANGAFGLDFPAASTLVSAALVVIDDGYVDLSPDFFTQLRKAVIQVRSAGQDRCFNLFN